MIKNLLILTLLAASSCATRDPFLSPENSKQTSREELKKAYSDANAEVTSKTLKRKVAVGRFTNETYYGKTFLRNDDLDPIGKQASDILASKLVKTEKFIVLERPDLSKIEKEQNITGIKNIVGANSLILGSVTEFGRSETGKKGFLSYTKIQIAKATVELRLVDVETGHVFFSASGSGEAQVESGAIAGFGSEAQYDASLNDKAISTAISSVIDQLIKKLESSPWKTTLLQKKGDNIIISGGARQGIKVGDTLAIMKKGEKIKSSQTGFMIDLPPTQIAKIKIISLFGDSEVNEGSIGKIVSGSIANHNISQLIIMEND